MTEAALRGRPSTREALLDAVDELTAELAGPAADGGPGARIAHLWIAARAGKNH